MRLWRWCRAFLILASDGMPPMLLEKINLGSTEYRTFRQFCSIPVSRSAQAFGDAEALQLA